MTIGPIEESFAMMNRYGLVYSSSDAERVDGLTYAWRKLHAQVRLCSRYFQERCISQREEDITLFRRPFLLQRKRNQHLSIPPWRSHRDVVFWLSSIVMYFCIFFLNIRLELLQAISFRFNLRSRQISWKAWKNSNPWSMFLFKSIMKSKQIY